MTLRSSLLKALDFALNVSTNRAVSLSTSTLRGNRGRQKVRLHVGMQSQVKGEVRQFSRTFDVLESTREDVTAVQADVLAAATSYVHGQGGQVL